MIINKKHTIKNSNAKFSIIIPTWNNLTFLITLVESIRKNSTFEHQIILHINDGTDGTLEWADKQADITYSQSKENIGICKAVNLAGALAYTDYILYINDDMYVCPNWDKYLWEEIQSIGHNLFFISATMIEFFDTKNPCVIVADFGKTLEEFDENKLLQDYHLIEKDDWNGSTWPPNVVHKDVWDMVGGYSIEFSPGMYSDPDFSKKLWELGVRYYKGLGKSRVYHFGSKSVKRIKKNKGKIAFLNKWGIPSSLFVKKFLKSGTKFSSILPDIQVSNSQKVISFFKKLKS